MRRYLCLAATLLILGPTLAAEDAKLNALSEKEMSDGWLLLFDGETTFGWKIDGEAVVKNGTLVLGGTKATTAVTTTAFGAYDIHLECGAVRAVQAEAKATIQLGGTMTIGYPLLDKADSKLSAQTVRVEGQERSSTPVRVTVPAGTQFLLRDIKLKPLRLKPLFNGKDLTGWKEHPGKKSVFTITDGAINIKNGPGDLQTEGQWADFVLQLECISNGKHLNSGVFFRCRPGEYQQGYEAQIHNGFGEQPKEYTLEDYDPQTNKLIGMRKEKYTALDYGTGAIYRRQPARKQMSKDNEWFAMTVVAQDRHLAVWVNGVQVTDWTDHRPFADNARKGCMIDKGNISLQGHDPTTDLSFRNFRIAELAAEKKAKE